MRNGASSELLLAENDRTFNALWVLGVEEGSFSCECGGTDFGERLDLTLIEYAARDDEQVLLARGHATAGAAPSSSVDSLMHRPVGDREVTEEAGGSPW